MRAKLYDVLDTKTGVMIGEGLRCREVSNLIDVDLDHISQYADVGSVARGDISSCRVAR